MLTIGLTGGIGSGKSTVAQILGEFGATVLDADKVAHTTYAPGGPAYDAVIAAFGAQVVAPDRTIDRKKLGAIVFGNPERLNKLTSIVWPATRESIRRNVSELRASGAELPIVVEAAILIEANWQSLFDEIWLVRAPREQVVGRIEIQRGLKPSESEARIRAQLSDEERAKHASLVIENNGSLEELRNLLKEVWADVLKRNG
ncbi:MAG TPA: dephospho-CoA kinase [Candidatus Binatus sp.]|uniref:dephospho-CoA kinase n=1 Tax=Candidatus Binatus sp. TaxID=2811406 RepID=UPI002B45AAEC|nr:dephospho-CoA kinase [Candidatus Binatus sp.]HKN13139.1 dephospho-CoA kinase [Candidatus Binatus sp.]